MLIIQTDRAATQYETTLNLEEKLSENPKSLVNDRKVVGGLKTFVDEARSHP